MTSPSTTTRMAPIASAEVFEIEAAFVTPYKLSFGTRTTTRAVMLKLTDADGAVGWGEADPSQPFTAESPADAAKALQETLLPAVLAADTLEPNAIDRMLDALLPDQLCAKGAVTMALLDLLGKRLRVPVSTLLGGALRPTLPVLWPLGNGTAEDDMRVIDERAAQGFASFMLKMGQAPARDELRRVAALESRYGDRFKFIADVNEGWNREQAREFLASLCGSRLAFLEQPLPKEDLEGMAALAKDSPVPLSADEAVTSLEEAARVAGSGAARVFSVKATKNGGPLRAQRIAAVAEGFGIQCYMNSMAEFGVTQAATLHLAATLPNLLDVGHCFMSTLRLKEDPTDFSSFVRKGTARLPEGPGLGVQVDEAHVRRLAVASFRLGGAR